MDWQVNTIDGPTKLVRQDASLGGLSIGQLTHCVVLQEWEDDRLTWNPATYGDVETAFAQPGKIWKPELVVDNSWDWLFIL